MTSDEKIMLIKQNDIWWNVQNLIFWKNKIDYNKTIVCTQNHLIIITSNTELKCLEQILLGCHGTSVR
jgi:hypothetical protein